MRITQIDLDNFKSYRHESILFTPGTNAICGPNGAGKSSLLEAIGFVLFGARSLNQSQLVKEGEKTATVTVHIADKDERVYQVVRKCGASNQSFVYDPEIKQKLAEGRAETTSWLREFLGVDEATDLAALFRNAIGVPQGLVTAAFLQSAANRKSVFDPLLRVDEYGRAWKALLDPTHELESSIHEKEREAAALEAESQRLPALREKARDLTKQIQENSLHLEKLQEELSRIAQRREALEAIKLHLDDLNRAVAKAEEQVHSLEVQHEEAQAAADRAEAARSIAEAAEAGHTLYIEAQANLADLEAQRQERDNLRVQLQAQRTQLALVRQRAKMLVAELRTVAGAEAQVEALAAQVEQQEQAERRLSEAERAADRLAAAQQILNQERERLTDLETQLGQAQAGLEERDKVKEEIIQLEAELADLTKQSSDLAAHAAAQEAEGKQIAEQIPRAAERLVAARQRLSQATEQLAEMERSLSRLQVGLSKRRQIEARIQQLRVDEATANAETLRVVKEGGRLSSEENHLSAQVRVLETVEAAACPVCGAPLTPEHQAELLHQNRAHLKIVQGAHSYVKAKLEYAEGTTAHIRAELQRLEEQAQDLPLQAQEEELIQRVGSQQDVVATYQADLRAMQTELEACEQSRQKTKAALTTDRRQQSKLETAREQKQAALATLTERRDESPRTTDVESLRAQVSKQKQSVDEAVQAVDALASAPQQVAALQAQLKQLGDPRRAYQRAADIAARREELEQQQAHESATIDDLEAQIAALAEQVAAYADLDTQMGTQRAQLAEHEADHRQYLEHTREAQMLGERRQRAADLEKKLADTRAEHRRLVQERDQAAGEYDAEAYSTLVSDHDHLRSDIATLTERLRQWNSQLQETTAEIEHLEEVEGRLAATRTEMEVLNDLLALLRYLRRVLRDAGPKVTRALVEIISLQAAQLYADIIDDHTARLRWSEDYDILLTTKGRERSFQQLSGGEEMAAALSVRLALLKEVSNIDVAFFDEPTANLDEERRENLAEQIMKVKGFSQLFVISHDDTFERDTDNVIRLARENGESRVEA